MGRIREQLDREAERYGINVVDVRIRRADLPEQNSQAVYQRMQTERQREAAEFRAQGSQRAQEIRSRADRDVTVLLAEANAKGEQIRGEGDANRNRIFAEAFNKDPDFFAFYRSMQAYETGLGHNDTRMVLKPDSEFFRYFVDPSGRSASSPPQQPAQQARRRRPGREVTHHDRAGRGACGTSWSRSGSCSRSKACCSRRFRAPPSRRWRMCWKPRTPMLRGVGIACAVIGIVLIWLVRG